MILVGNSRGGGQDLANHLLKEENDHIEVYDLRHFVSDDLHGAFREAYALSKATRAKKYLFSLSLNPPEGEAVETPDFEHAIAQVEDKLGLGDQPRAIVFHEKEGRRHCHVVWSRIDSRELKAIPMDYCRNKMKDVARELYLRHGWQMPEGFRSEEPGDPRNFSLEEWQQARRQGKDPRAIKAMFQENWAISDSAASFIQAMAEYGHVAARGDRRGYVTIDRDGEIYAISKWVGIRTKDVRARLGESQHLPCLKEAREKIAHDMAPAFDRWSRQMEERIASLQAIHRTKKAHLKTRHQKERTALSEFHEKRRIAETQLRQERFSRGWRGIWDRLRGQHRKIKNLNEQEAREADLRDRRELDALIVSQLTARQELRNEYQQQAEQIRKHKSDLARSIEEVTRADRAFERKNTARMDRAKHGPSWEP